VCKLTQFSFKKWQRNDNEMITNVRPTAKKFALYNKRDSMRWFSHRRILSCHPWVAT